MKPNLTGSLLALQAQSFLVTETSHSCFLYAFKAYDAVKRQFGEWASEKKWRWGDIGGAGNAGIKDAIGLGWSTLFKSYYLGHAKKFKDERGAGLNWYGDRRPIVDNLDIVDQVKSFFESSENQQALIQINDCVQSSQALAEKIIDDGKNWTQEFNKLQSTLVERTSKDTEGQKYVDLYKTFEVPVEMNEVMAEGAGDFETKKAMEIVVGRILTEAQKH
ncbi:hypothetical protein Forpe1208_v008222 [Fusarium oxysporum f. sp. rapae]|uniref:Uncharacterized protein n=1 Tax=Fusarium oxysporum f. sp. rapae TaxID=485398 RepID=A0A8J5NYA8_FUSOX|nr:hypothetical protein Forpe1208_v008222 [Fusarium oxysporum f. sp. rapae]